MGKIYVNQTSLKLEAEVKADLTNANTVLIKYIKPDDSTGQFTATVTDATFGVIEYIITSSTDIDQVGDWTFWGHITFSNGDVIAGEPHCETVYKEGT